jgi:murein DD-endopeptidase MepM/ murein hydrolase activator NlpD
LKAGDLVKGGSKIGATGVSGNADKKYPHLHFDIRDTAARQGGLRGRFDPSTVLGGALLSCGSEEIGGIDTVRMACIEKGASTPLFGR